MIGVLERVKDKDTRDRFNNKGTIGSLCHKHYIENGLIMRSFDDTMIISSPLIMSHDQINELIEKAIKALDLTRKSLN